MRRARRAGKIQAPGGGGDRGVPPGERREPGGLGGLIPSTPLDFLVSVCNARGWREEYVAARWTFRRVLHAYLTLQGERNAPFAMLFRGLSGSGASPGRRAAGPAAGAGRPPYSWWRPRSSRTHVRAAHVEDPLSVISASVPVGGLAPYERRGGRLERVATPLRGVGKTERRRVGR